jgi:hypothetical protein
VEVASSIVGTLAEGCVVEVLDKDFRTVSTVEGKPTHRTKIRFESDGEVLVGWVTSSLLISKRKDHLTDNTDLTGSSPAELTDGAEKERAPRRIGRQISLQRPKIHVSL